MKTPTPTRYCPVLDRNHLPMDAIRVLPNYQSMFPLVDPVKKCLCNTVAEADLICDPSICAKKLTEGVKWAINGDNPVAMMGGVGKRIYREYAKDHHKDELRIDPKVNSFLDELLDEDGF